MFRPLKVRMQKSELLTILPVDGVLLCAIILSLLILQKSAVLLQTLSGLLMPRYMTGRIYF